MRLKTQRRVIYAVMGLTVLALSSGFALASLNLGGSNTVQQGSQKTSIEGVQGLGWLGTTLTTVPSPASNTSGCDTSGGCSVTAAAAQDCVGSVSTTFCQAGDFVEEVLLTTEGAAFGGTVHVTTYLELASGVTYVGTTLNYTDTGTGFFTIIQYFDIGSVSTGLAAVATVDVVATVS